MREVILSLALIVAVLALAGAALRLVSPVAPRGLERLVAASVVAVALAIAEALALGLVGLGAAPGPLVAAAVATWLGARALRPVPEVAPAGELRRWWSGLEPAARVAAAAAGGAGAAWVAWQLRYPSIGFDSALYHYPLVAGWIENGRPGSGLVLSYDIPYGSYPLTDEVALTWAAGIVRSWVPLSLWNPALLLLLGAAGWRTLRNLGAGGLAAGLGTAALVTSPIVVRQLNEPQTDLPAFAWLAATAGLATGAGRRPGLLVPALLAAGLAVGTKPSAAPMAAVALALGAWRARDRLRPLAGPLALGAAGAVVVGGLWYARNLVEHGSPLWPFVQGPWGDPRPEFFALVDATFLQRPGATLDGRLREYAERLGGGWVLVAAAPLVVLAGLLARRREPRRARTAMAAGGLALLALLIWSTAWGTGLVRTTGLAWAEGFSISALRYMLPAIGAAVLAVALAAGLPGVAGRAMTGVLALAVVWNLVEDARLGSPWTPSVSVVAVGALGGMGLLGLLALAAGRAPGPLRRRETIPALAVVAVVAVTGLLVVAGRGYVERSLDVAGSSAYGRELVAWFVGRPGFGDGEEPIAFASRGVLAQLAGDRFAHRLELVPQRASCAEALALARRQPVVTTETPFFQGLLGVVDYSVTPRRCFGGSRPAFATDPYYVYGPAGGALVTRAGRPPGSRLR